MKSIPESASANRVGNVFGMTSMQEWQKGFLQVEQVKRAVEIPRHCLQGTSNPARALVSVGRGMKSIHDLLSMSKFVSKPIFIIKALKYNSSKSCIDHMKRLLLALLSHHQMHQRMKT